MYDYCVIYFFIFLFGLALGSFFNVCIYRIPKKQSIIHPRSFCPFCKNTIKWFYNIPVFSFVFLKGRCAYCKEKISFRYVFVELITAISGIVLFFYFSFKVFFVIYWILICFLIIVSFIDLEYKEIPDEITIPGIFLGLFFLTFFGNGNFHFSKTMFFNSLFGLIIGALSMIFMGIVGEFFFKKKSEQTQGAIGGGDIKLMAMIGSFIGWKCVLLTFFIAPLLGSVYGLYVFLKKKETLIPYGPYLSIAAFLSIIYGNIILKYFFI